MNAIWNFIRSNKWIVFGVFLAAGLLICFTGRKLFKVVLFTTAMLAVTIAGMVLAYSAFLYKSQEQWVGWVTLAVCILIGAGVGFIMLKLLRFGIFLIAGFGGFCLGLVIWDAFLYFVQSQVVMWISLIAFALLCGLIALKIEETVLILATSFTGAYLMFRGIGMVAPGWPNSFTLSELMNTKAIDSIDPYFYAYLAGIVIFTILGCVVQFKQKKKDDEADRHPYTRYRNKKRGRRDSY